MSIQVYLYSPNCSPSILFILCCGEGSSHAAIRIVHCRHTSRDCLEHFHSFLFRGEQNSCSHSTPPLFLMPCPHCAIDPHLFHTTGALSRHGQKRDGFAFYCKNFFQQETSVNYNTTRTTCCLWLPYTVQ